MIASAFPHVAHVATSLAVLHLPEKAKSAVPLALSIAGLTPLQIEMLGTGFALLVQALIFAALRVKTAMPARHMLSH